MLGRIASALALTSMAALVLVGCTPDEPTDEEILAEATESINGFFGTVDEQYAAGVASENALQRFATAELASRWAGDIQSLLDAGTVSRGVPSLESVELEDRAADSVSVHLCADQSEIETTLADGSTVTPQSLVAWDVRLVESEDQPLVVNSMEPAADQSICGA